MTGSLADKVAVVTGASAGVGRATVRALAAQGARIGLIARGRDRLEAARREVESLGGEALVLPLDVARAEQVEDAADQIERRLGPIDWWINNAIVTVYSPFRHMTPEEFHRVTDVCYHGYVHGTLAALKRMVLRDRGVIVQVGSALAYRSIPLQSAYCGAKHAIVGFTDSIRCELLHEGSSVRLTAVHLPALNTPQFVWGRSRLPNKAQPVPPIFQPEVAADAILWAARHCPRELNVGMSTETAIAGQKIAPGIADRFLGATGVAGAMTDEPAEADRPDNLFDAPPGDFGAHGPFDHRASDSSPHLQINKHRGLLAVLGAAAVVGLTVVLNGKGNG